MAKLVWLNGKISPLETATTSVADHAFLYGDGLFEGIRIYDGKIFRFDEHINRIYHGARCMGFEQMMPKEEMKAIILDVCKQANESYGYIRLNVTRGTGLGLDPKNINRKPNVMVMVNVLALYSPESYDTGLDVITTSFRVIPADSLDPRIKCIGRYASNIMAKAEANRAGAGEGLMLNHEGYVAECTGDNIFMVKDGVIITPLPSCGILQGITRDAAIYLGRKAGYRVDETLITKYDLFSADECFLTGTAAEVIPMVTLDTQNIGDGKPGKVTKEIMELFRAETRNTGTPFMATEAAVSN